MAKTFDPARLFERWKPLPAPYDDDESELDAVAAGTKGMSMFVTSSNDDDLAHWVRHAAKRDLVAAFHADGSTPNASIHAFLAKPEELWRVPAYLALWNTAFVEGRWSDASENLAGHLLGYTKAQRKTWLAARRRTSPAWTCATVYAVLSPAQREVVDSVGRRCFGPADSLPGLTLFVHAGVLKPTARALLPDGHTLARVGLAWTEAKQLFGPWPWKTKPLTKTISKRLAPTVNAGLRSNVEFLTGAGWR